MIGTRDALPTQTAVEYFAGVEVEDVAARSLDLGECVAAEVETARVEGTALAPDEVRAWLIEQARAWLLVEHESDLDDEAPAASTPDLRGRMQAWVDDDDGGREHDKSKHTQGGGRMKKKATGAAVEVITDRDELLSAIADRGLLQFLGNEYALDPTNRRYALATLLLLEAEGRVHCVHSPSTKPTTHAKALAAYKRGHESGVDDAGTPGNGPSRILAWSATAEVQS